MIEQTVQTIFENLLSLISIAPLSLCHKLPDQRILWQGSQTDFIVRHKTCTEQVTFNRFAEGSAFVTRTGYTPAIIQEKSNRTLVKTSGFRTLVKVCGAKESPKGKTINR